MNPTMLACLGALIAGIAYGHPTGDIAGRQEDNPCARIQDKTADQEQDGPVDFPTVEPSLAYRCLESIPLYAEKDKELLDYLRPALDWQSTLNFLANPPEEYLSQGVDLLQGFDDLKERLDGGEYGNQYEFMKDLYILLSIRPRDGHMGYTPALLDVFTFEMGVTLVSVAPDTTSKPSIFVYDDKDAELEGYEASPIKSINGKDAEKFIQEASLFTDILHDPDARYNEYFRNPATDFFVRYKQPVEHMLDMADTTSIEFQNGTTREYQNVAYVTHSFSHVSSGEDLHQEVEVDGVNPVQMSRSIFTEDERYGKRLGYPEPAFVHPDNITTGYLFDSGDLSETAVINVHAFMETGLNTTIDIVPKNETSLPGIGEIAKNAAYGKIFADVMISTIKAAKDQGKRHLILDLQGNHGGALYANMLAYHVLFPGSKNPWRYRARASAQLQWLGEAGEKALDNPLIDAQIPDYVQNMIPWPVGYHYMLDENDQPFGSYADMFGPEEISGDKFTKLAREAPLDSEGAWPPEYKWDQPWDEPPFKPEDISIVTDGNCVSACAFYVGALSREHGVRTVAMGGRPIEAPMQSMGGTKGGPALNLVSVSSMLDIVEMLEKKPEELDTIPGLNDTAPIKNAAPFTDFNFRINVGNVYPSETMTDGQLPLQFVYEAANCKLFYTWEMIRDVKAVWEAVAKVSWGDGKCVSGSTANEDGTMGDSTPGYSDKVNDVERLDAGPGSLAVDGGRGGTGGGIGDDGDENAASPGARDRFSVMIVALGIVFLVQCML